MDCAGVCFGTARIDRCNVCAGGNTTLKFNDNVDACGVCNGTNSTCTGCDGVPNSGKKIDYCGECWHPFDAQYNANCTKMVDFLPKAAASDGDVKIAIIGAGFHRFKNAECVFSATFNGSGIGFPAVPVNLSEYLSISILLLLGFAEMYTRIGFHYQYASVVMMGLIFLAAKQHDAIKHT